MKSTLFAAAALLLTACTLPPQPAPAPAPEPLVLETHAVPAGKAPEVVSLINRLFHSRVQGVDNLGNPVGVSGGARAVEGPSGAVVVVASASLQAGVRDLLATLPDQADDGPRAMELEYWFATATPADGHAHPDGLAPIADALAAVESVTGPATWTTLAHRRLVSLDSERGELEGESVTVEQVLSWQADRGVIVADVHTWMRRSGGTKTRVELRPDQTLVLSEVGGADETLYTFVRARRAE